ncbi:MAG: SDR family NAD(P)-dependent oxidoreductase [Thermodesulfobacteriota bacterium]
MKTLELLWQKTEVDFSVWERLQWLFICLKINLNTQLSGKNQMKTLKNKIVVITGAGGGIGRSLAFNFAKEGADIAISDIDKNALMETENLLKETGVNVFSQRLDVSDRSAMEKYPEAVVTEMGGVDIIVNNAGVVVVSTVEEHSVDDYEWLMGINFWGVLYGSKFFIPYLKKAEEACIINISSIFGMVSMPNLSSYNAAKFAIRGFSDSLQHELHGSNIRVMGVYPGGVKTDFARKARFNSTPGKKKTSHQEFNTIFEKYSMSTPDSTSRAVIKGLKKRKKRVLVGLDAVSGEILSRLMPVGHGWMIRFIGSRV